MTASEHPAAPAPASVPPADQVSAHETSRALRNGVKMGASLLITWSVALIVKMRVPAHLGPIRQGHFGFAESFAAMFFATLGLGIDTYLIKEVAVRPKHASEVVGGVFALRLMMSLVLFAAMWAVLLVTGRPASVVLAATVFGIVNVVIAFNATLGAVLQGVSCVGPPARANVVTKVVWGAGLLIGLHYDVPIVALALPALAGEVLRALILAPAARSLAGLRFRVQVPAVRAALKQSFPFFVNSLALGVIGSLGMSALEFISVDEREVGWFAAAQNVAALCMLLSPLIFWVIMPLLSRAFARSESDGMAVFRRCVDALVIAVLPIAVLISAGADILIRVAFGWSYAPARTGLSILSLMFVMTYLDMMLGTALIIMGKGWSVTTISISAVFVTATLMLVFVPLGRHFLGLGGECAGAASAVIASEMFVLVGMVSRFRNFPFDSRNLSVFAKSGALGALVLIADRLLRGLGPARLGADAILLVVVALAIKLVRVEDLRRMVGMLRRRGEDASVDSYGEVGGGGA
jgi:O-antigen/teichoic acid export membrane protein